MIQLTEQNTRPSGWICSCMTGAHCLHKEYLLWKQFINKYVIAQQFPKTVDPTLHSTWQSMYSQKGTFLARTTDSQGEMK